MKSFTRLEACLLMAAICRNAQDIFRKQWCNATIQRCTPCKYKKVWEGREDCWRVVAHDSYLNPFPSPRSKSTFGLNFDFFGCDVQQKILKVGIHSNQDQARAQCPKYFRTLSVIYNENLSCIFTPYSLQSWWDEISILGRWIFTPLKARRNLNGKKYFEHWLRYATKPFWVEIHPKLDEMKYQCPKHFWTLSAVCNKTRRILNGEYSLQTELS